MIVAGTSAIISSPIWGDMGKYGKLSVTPAMLQEALMHNIGIFKKRKSCFKAIGVSKNILTKAEIYVKLRTTEEQARSISE